MQKKRIGIDCRLINETGVGIYIQNLLRNLPLEKNQFELYLFTDSNGRKVIAKSISLSNVTIVETYARWHSFNEQVSFFKTISKYNLDLMHFTYFSYPILYTRPFVLTIHDLTPLDFKTGQATTLHPLAYEFKYNAYKFLLYWGISKAAHIITPSKAVCDQILKRFKQTNKQKITVTYEGVDEGLLTSKSNNTLKSIYKDPFIVRLGNFYPHKNIERLISAFSMLDTNVKLVLAGPKDFFASRIVELAQAVENNRSILFHFNATLEDRVFFYKNALALVQPSLTEGFGLPIIEANHFKCPVILSDIPVFKELVGNKYQYFFDPMETLSMKDTIGKFLENNPIRSDAECINSSVINQFSFGAMGNTTYGIYKMILN